MPIPDYLKDLIVRLETSRSHLAILATLQHLAGSQLNNLVPSVLDVGITTAAAAKQVEYLVTAYFTGTIPLDDVWGTLDQAHQLEVVDSVILAVDMLQKLDLGQHKPDSSRMPLYLNRRCLSEACQDCDRWSGVWIFRVKKFLGGLLQASNQELFGWIAELQFSLHMKI